MRINILLVVGSAVMFIAIAESSRNQSNFKPSGIICNLTTPEGTDSLNSGQRQGVQRAIDSIRTPPPASIGYQMASGAHRTAPCGDIADDLQKQLNSGRIRVDTTGEGGFAGRTDMDDEPTTDGDQLVLRESFLDSVIAGLIPWVHLEEILVHERKHKQQKEDDEWDLEIPACSMEKSYKDSCGVADTNRWYRLCVANLNSALWAHAGEQESKSVRNIRSIAAQAYEHFLVCDTTEGMAGVDTFTTFPWGEGTWSQFPLLGMRASDHLLFLNLPTSPPGCVRSLICGGVPGFGVGRILSLCVCSGQVSSIEAVRDFGPPAWPPAFFFAMDRSKSTGRFFVLDTLTKQILKLEDFDQDRIPDEVGGVYASAFWPGFDGLLAARGIDIDIHIFLGEGVIVNFFDAHLPHVTAPGDSALFLPDADGDLVADACIPVHLYEFRPYLPAICIPPWHGDTEITVLASWTHLIEIWQGDSLGQNLVELLAAGTMTTGGKQTHSLTRPVVAGEYLIARDLTWNWQLTRAITVVDPTPQRLTLAVQDGSLHFRWSAVQGADHYHLQASFDSEQFDDTGIESTTNELILPFDPSLPKQFYRVAAVRGE